jgi:multidrug efflux pump subunit AcrB
MLPMGPHCAPPCRPNWQGATYESRKSVQTNGAASAGILGHQVAVLREGRKQIPVVARLRMEERAQLSDLQNLYVYASQTTEKVPLMMFSSIDYKMRTEKIKRRDHFRTITVQAFPAAGALASQVINAALPRIEELQKTLPPGYKIEIGGEAAHQAKGFAELKVVLLVSIAAIFVALVIQFNNAVKPLLVFAAVPYGAVGALGGLLLMGAPFGFIAFLGIASLVGVIISHVIVLFDFIEDRREKGEPLQDALLDSGILRLRPVLITVGATVTALIPLSMHGGPLWKPLCYTQIGGLLVATFIELLLVKVLYAIFVLDLKFVKWETTGGLGGDGHLSDRQSGSLAPHAQAQTAMPV